MLEPDSHAAKSTFLNHIQQCYAIKPSTDPLLQLARTSFSRTTQLIQELAGSYQQLHPRLQVKVGSAFLGICARQNNVVSSF